MADEEKKEEAAPAPDAAKKEGDKKEGAEGAAGAPKAKSKISVLHIGLGGGAAAVIAMAYFLTVAAIQTGDAAHQALQEQMKNPTGTPTVDEHGNPIDPEHGKEEKKEEEKKEEGGHGEEGGEGGGEHGEAGKEGAAAEPKGPGTAYIKLDEIKINPNQAGLKRFLLVQFGFAFESEDASGLAAKLQSEEGMKGPIKHRLIRLLKSKTVDDLDGDAHTNLLLREVREIINQELFAGGKGKVTGVFLEQFIVQ